MLSSKNAHGITLAAALPSKYVTTKYLRHTFSIFFRHLGKCQPSWKMLAMLKILAALVIIAVHVKLPDYASHFTLEANAMSN